MSTNPLRKWVIDNHGNLVRFNNQSSKCPDCGELFSSDKLLQLHRVTIIATGQDRCMRPDEMVRIGLWPNVVGIWASRPRAITSEMARKKFPPPDKPAA